MISDVLSEAVDEIDRYLASPVYAGIYQGATRSRLELLRDYMDKMRAELDTPPRPADVRV